MLFNTLDSERSTFGEVKNQDQKIRDKSVEVNLENESSMPTQEEDTSYYFGPRHIQNRMKPKSIFMKEKSSYQDGSKFISFHASPSKQEPEESKNFDGEPSSETQEQRLMEFKKKARIRKVRRANLEVVGLDLASKDSHKNADN